MEDTTLTPAEFVALFNQTVEAAWPIVSVEGELTDFRISKNRWLYFKLQDEEASVEFFGSVYNLPGPLEDGLTLKVVGSPRLHPRFGFSISVQTIVPVGEGAIKKAAELLHRKLAAEGLFEPARKRPIPFLPENIGLITAAGSAAYADFTKILTERWGGLQIQHIDVFVQGEQSPLQIVGALEHFNRLAQPPEIVVLTRGGGSLEDLAAFSDERVVRAVAASRVPTVVAVGHEVDVSLAELAADMHASTPSNAAALIVPDKNRELISLAELQSNLVRRLATRHAELRSQALQTSEQLRTQLKSLVTDARAALEAAKSLAKLLSPHEALKRGYAVLSSSHGRVASVKHIKAGDQLSAKLADGTIGSVVNSVKPDARAS